MEEENIVEELKEQILNYIAIPDTDEIRFYASQEQLKEMFKDFSEYIGEIQNPDNSAINPFFKKPDGSGSLYAPLNEVLNNAKPVLAKHGFGFFQVPTAKTGQVSVKTILTHKSGAMVCFPALTIPISKNDAQGVIAGVTYARRGSLNPILGTHGETDDDGNTASGTGASSKGKPGSQKAAIPPEVVEKRKNVIALANELGKAKVNQTIIYKAMEDKNPNAITDVAALDKMYSALDDIRKNTSTKGDKK